LYGCGRNSTGSGDSESSEPQYIDDLSEWSLPLLDFEVMAGASSCAPSLSADKHKLETEVRVQLSQVDHGSATPLNYSPIDYNIIYPESLVKRPVLF
jgi:hypothetical protein